jgi:polyisoprenoid-binding protein YceI
MSTTTDIRHRLPTGTWRLDPVHSSIGFEIEYMAGTFHGQFRDVEATLAVDADAVSLTGAANVASVDVKDENLAAHLQSPEFFDVERYPELRFVSTDVTGGGDDLTVRGEIAIKGVSQPAELTGRATAPLTDAYGRERIGLTLSTTLDRTVFGLSWNLPLPSGEPALSHEVTLDAELYFVKEA